jgi:hypothetical protein
MSLLPHGCWRRHQRHQRHALPAVAAVSLLIAVAVAPRSAFAARTFSGGVSQGHADATPRLLLNHTLTGGPNTTGVLTSWWAGGSDDDLLLSFFVDGEATPSVSGTLAELCGSPFGAPGGAVTTFESPAFGKGAATGGWYSTVPIPFYASLVITYAAPSAGRTVEVWLWARGAEGAGVAVTLPGGGHALLPRGARLQRQTVAGSFAPLAYVDIARVPAGRAGLLYAATLAGTSANLNFLEGCVHLFPTASSGWPDAQLLATGTEDYFLSSYYFDAGVFAQPLAGALTLDTNGDGGAHRVAAYRVHTGADPIVFEDGAAVVWRVGDNGAGGLKCNCPPPGGAECVTAGDPQETLVSVAAWLYTWDAAAA